MWELYLLRIMNEVTSAHVGNRWKEFDSCLQLFYINNAIKKTRYLLKDDWEDEDKGVNVDVEKYTFSKYDDLKEARRAIMYINRSRMDDEADFFYICKDAFDVMNDTMFEKLCQVLGAKKEFKD